MIWFNSKKKYTLNKRLAAESQTNTCKSKPWYAKTMKILSMVAISTNAEDTNRTP